MKRHTKIISLVLVLALAFSAMAILGAIAVGEKTVGTVKTLYDQGATKFSISNTPAEMTLSQKTATNGIKYYTVAYKDGWSVEAGGYSKEPFVQFAPTTHYLKNGWRNGDTKEGTDDTDYLVIDFDISTETNHFDQLFFQTLFYYGKKTEQADGSYKGVRTSAQSGHYVLYGDSGEDSYFTASTEKTVRIPIDVQSDDEWAHITMVVDTTADKDRTMHLYYNGQYIASRVCMTDNATYLESVRIGLGTQGVAPDIGNETFSIANATIKSFSKGYSGELAEEKANLGSALYPLSSFSDLGYCLSNLPENNVAKITHADSTETLVTKISELDGNLQSGDTVTLYRDIARKIVVPGKVDGDEVVPDVTFELGGHSMVAPLALEDYNDLDWIIRDANGDLYSYEADGAAVYAKGAQVYTDGKITTDNLSAYLNAAFPSGISGGKTLKFTFLKDTTIKYTAALKHGESHVTYDLNGNKLTMAGGQIPFQSTAATARIVIRGGELVNGTSNPVYCDKGAKTYIVNVDLNADKSFSDWRSGTLFFIGSNITNSATVVAVKSYGGSSTAAVIDGCTFTATGTAPLFAGNISTGGSRRGSTNNFIGVYNTQAHGDTGIINLEYYANEYQSGNATTKANRNKTTLSIQGSSFTTDGGSAVTVGIESLLDKNNSYAFAEGFDATTDIYVADSEIDAEYVVSSDDDTATTSSNANSLKKNPQIEVGAYTAHTNLTIKDSKIATPGCVFANTVGSGSDNGSLTATLCDGVKLTGMIWAAEGNSAVNVEFAEDVKLAYSYDSAYPYIATTEWTESTLVGDRPEITTVKLSPIFADGMVLQGHKDINVYGSCATIGATIEVKIGDNAATTTVGGDGKWSVTIAPMDYANGLTLYVNEVGLRFPETKIENVKIGEIFMMSGQSNSVYGTYKMEDFAEYRSNADNFDNIYAFAVNQGQSIVERTETANSGWYKVDSKTLTKDDRYTGISAIAYVMATRLATELGEDVAIGIIDINFNGSTVEAWMSPENLAEVDPELNAKYSAYRNYYIENGTYPSESDVSQYGSYVASGKLYQNMACACYNAMIAPFFDGFAIRGAIWYQGEGNSGSVTADSDGSYTAHFNGVRNTFRDAFDDDELPVFIIQIPPRVGNPFYFRALQYDLAKNDDNTYLVSSLYASSTYSSNELKYTNPGESMVHYERKSPVGLALADSVLEHVYGMADRSAPEILSVEKRDGAIVITFDTELTVDMGSEMLGFEIAGADKEWVRATATYRDKTVTLSAEGVSAPEYVRYGSGKSILVFEDGTEIIHNKDNAKFAYDEANGIVTITVGEKIYTIDINDPAVIGGRMPCNVVATNGTALPVFLAIAI